MNAQTSEIKFSSTLNVVNYHSDHPPICQSLVYLVQ